MILIMGGYPQSGKSEFARKLSKAIDKWVIHLDSKEWLPENFSELDEKDQKLWRTCAWELAGEKLTRCAEKLPNQVLIIYDTTASKSHVIQPMIDYAKKKGHDVIYVFVDASLEDRQSWCEESIDLAKIQPSYVVNFKTSIPVLKAQADYFCLIKNSKDEAGFQAMDSGIEKLAGYIKQVRN